MPSVGDVVKLPDDSVGVIAEALPSPQFVPQWRVEYPDGYSVITTSEIVETLAAPSYSVGEEVTVWPDLGTIQTISGADITVRLSKSIRIEGVGHPQWETDVTVPLWRIIKDNDTRLERVFV